MFGFLDRKVKNIGDYLS